MRPQLEAGVTRQAQHEFLDDVLGRRVRSEAEREAAFRRPPSGAIADRWHIYSHGYTARIVGALEQEYAAVSRIAGSEAFAALVERYLTVFTPRSFDLARAGDRLAQFLEFDHLSTELPFLPDLAGLERRISESFTAADARPLSWADLQARSADDVATLRLSLAPGVALVRSAWPLEALWKCRLENRDEAISIPIENRPSVVLVVRRDLRVFVETISETEATLLESASAGGLTLPDLHGLSGAPESARAVAELIGTFRRLIARGVFVLTRSTGWTGALQLSKEDIS